MHKLDSKRYRKIRLLKFFKAFDDSPHHIAAVEQLQCEMPDELLNKFSDWVICFEANKEVDTCEYPAAKGYIIDTDNMLY
tara:strand:- start:10532 stop:10771 length:240 start_codon:yes stop_codon:yes gene_type:complete